MKDKFEVIFLNEFDSNIFDEYFYKHLLSKIVNLIKAKEEQTQNGSKTCACHRQVEDKSFGSQA